MKNLRQTKKGIAMKRLTVFLAAACLLVAAAANAAEDRMYNDVELPDAGCFPKGMEHDDLET